MLRICLLWCVSGLALQAQSPNQAQLPALRWHDDPAAGAKLWAQAIEAKGGETKLRAVKSLSASSIQTFWRSFLGIPASSARHGPRKFLFVVPDRLWTWTDQRDFKTGWKYDDLFSLVAMKEDVQSGQRWSYNSLFPNSRGFRPLSAQQLAREKRSLAEAAFLLLLTPGDSSPKALRVAHQWEGLIPQDCVEVETSGIKPQLCLNSRTHLPETILFPEDKNIVRLSDYQNISGLLLPGTIRLSEGGLPFPWLAGIHMQWEVNPGFEENFFTEAIGATPTSDAWRRR